MIEYQPDSKHIENQQRYKCQSDQMPCCICGHPVVLRWGTPYVHIHKGGLVVVTEDEASGLDESGDVGMWPIGSSCLHKHPELEPYLYYEEPE